MESLFPTTVMGISLSLSASRSTNCCLLEDDGIGEVVADSFVAELFAVC